MDKQGKVKVGDTLTVSCNIIDISGNIILSKDQTVNIREIEYTGGYYSDFFNMYIPKEISMVKLEGIYGLWSASTFKELKP